MRKRGYEITGNAISGAGAVILYAAIWAASPALFGFLPGGLGVTEGAMTLLLVKNAIGVDRGTATAATILTRLATLWFAVLLGAVALVIARRRAAAAEAAAAAAAA